MNNEFCYYCGAIAKTKDHLIPRAKGGTSRKDNLVPACAICNNYKGANSVEDFIKFMEFTRTLGYTNIKMRKWKRRILAKRFTKATGIVLTGQ